MADSNKNVGGRPPLFKTPEELQSAIDKYFQSLIYMDTEGREQSNPMTVTGLALGLGFCDRQSMYDYEKRDKFSCIIKKARLHVENCYERALFTKASTGAIFALKNMGWRDKQEVTQEHTFTGAPKITFSDD